MLHFCLHPNFLNKISSVVLWRRLKNILVIADHNNHAITPLTQKILTAAKQIGGDVTVLVAGTECSSASRPLAKAAKSEGFKKVLVAENSAFDSFQDENLTELILALQKDYSFSHIIAGASRFGKTIIPRVAAKLDVNPISDVIEIINYNTFVRPIYSGNAHVTIKTKDPINVMTIRENAFLPCTLQEDYTLDSKLDRITKIEKIAAILNSKRKSKDYNRLQKVEASIRNWKSCIDHGIPVMTPLGECDLGFKSMVDKNTTLNKLPQLLEANIVICGGKGLKTSENFNQLYKLAGLLNAAVGASGGAVEAGIAPKEIEIGQNGKIVAPNLYFAIGVSGKSQHLVGMKDSNIIVAINNDKKAPIFNIADYCLVGNVSKIVPKLTTQLKYYGKPRSLFKTLLRN